MTIADNVSPDITPISGVVRYVNSSFGGTWSVDVTTVAKPFIGSAAIPKMGLHVYAKHLGADTNTLTITFAESGYDAMRTGSYAAGLGGNAEAHGTVRLRNFVDTRQFADSGVLNGVPIVPYNASGSFCLLDSPFSLAMQAELTSSNTDGSIGFDASLSIEKIPIVLDVGLRLFDGTATHRIACEVPGPDGCLESPLRFAKNGTIYGIVLGETDSPAATGIHVRTSSGIKAWMKLP